MKLAIEQLRHLRPFSRRFTLQNVDFRRSALLLQSVLNAPVVMTSNQTEQHMQRTLFVGLSCIVAGAVCIVGAFLHVIG